MEFQSLMAAHQRELIREIEEDHQNPLAAWLESRLAKASVKKLLRKHTAFRIREVLVALSESDGFPLAKYIWNAAHPDVPLHCFFRIRREPVFQILSMHSEGNTIEVHMEIHRARNRQKVILTRDAHWKLSARSFPKASGQG